MHIVKEEFYKFSKILAMNIFIAHYPAYCSNWNPIEHKLFPHLHRTLNTKFDRKINR